MITRDTKGDKGMRLYGFDSKEDVQKQFEIPEEEFKGVEILFGNYGSWSYDGAAMVVFRKDGKLYQVEGEHCSCHGLEGQWNPTETCLEALNIYKCDSDYFDKEAVTGWNEMLEEIK